MSNRPETHNAQYIVESYFPETPIVFYYQILKGSLRTGLKYETKVERTFSEKMTEEIFRVLNKHRNINKDLETVTKSDVISVPLDFYKENFNKKIVNSKSLKNFIAFYISVKGHTLPLLSSINVPNNFISQSLAEFYKKDNQSEDKSFLGSLFQSDSLNSKQWIDLKSKLKLAFNGDRDCQKFIMDFLNPTFEKAEKEYYSLFENTTPNLPRVYFEKIKINGFLRINKNENKTKYESEPYLMVDHIFIANLNQQYKLIITENMLSPFSKIKDCFNYFINEDINETNFVNFIPEKINDNRKYNRSYSVYLINTLTNQSKSVVYDNISGLETYEDAENKALEFLNNFVDI